MVNTICSCGTSSERLLDEVGFGVGRWSPRGDDVWHRLFGRASSAGSRSACLGVAVPDGRSGDRARRRVDIVNRGGSLDAGLLEARGWFAGGTASLSIGELAAPMGRRIRGWRVRHDEGVDVSSIPASRGGRFRPWQIRSASANWCGTRSRGGKSMNVGGRPVHRVDGCRLGRRMDPRRCLVHIRRRAHCHSLCPCCVPTAPWMLAGIPMKHS